MRASAPLRERVGSVPGDDDGLPGERAAGRALFGRCQPHACRIEPFEQPARSIRAQKKETTAAALSGPTSSTAQSCSSVACASVSSEPEGLGQQLSGLFTDMPDAERVQEFGKRRGLGAFNRGNQVGGALFGEALQRRKVGSFQ